MASLADVVLNVQKSNKQPATNVPTIVTTNDVGSTTAISPVSNTSGSPVLNTDLRPKAGSPSSPRRRSIQSSYKQIPMSFPHTTPSERTGPPRSISYGSLPNSRVVSRTNSRTDGVYPLQTEASPPVAGPSTQVDLDANLWSLPESGHPEPQFRDALGYDDPDQREKEREYLERIERRKLRDSRLEEWNPIRWLTDSPRDTPKEERPPFEFGAASETEKGENGGRPKMTHPLSLGVQSGGSPLRRKRDTRRANSLPPTPKRQDFKGKEKRSGAPRWGRLRSLLPTVITQSRSQTSQPGGSSALSPHSVNITDELISGRLSALMLKLWFERDEKGHRRVPILLHRLRIRISDSLHPLDGNKAVFRIECEYANGAVRWVIYRQLREFLSLHTHYAFSNAYNRNIETLPEFPKTSTKCPPPFEGNRSHGLP